MTWVTAITSVMLNECHNLCDGLFFFFFFFFGGGGTEKGDGGESVALTMSRAGEIPL